MDDARVQAIARALCRSARIDPDSILQPDGEQPCSGSVTQATKLMPAWERFRTAAENYCAARQDFRMDLSVPRASNSKMAG